MRTTCLAVALFLSVPAAAQQREPLVKKITLDLHKADLHSVIRLFAEISRSNFVVADDVQGQVSIRLRNVPWSQALEVILHSRGLGMERVGNIYRVAPLKTLAEEAELRAKKKDADRVTAELVTTIIPVSYARAADLVPFVKESLSPRGRVTFDERTNVLIVTDSLDEP